MIKSKTATATATTANAPAESKENMNARARNTDKRGKIDDIQMKTHHPYPAKSKPHSAPFLRLSPIFFFFNFYVHRRTHNSHHYLCHQHAQSQVQTPTKNKKTKMERECDEEKIVKKMEKTMCGMEI